MLRARRSANELRRRVYEILERDTPGDWASTIVARFIVLLIVVNLAAVVLESMPPLAARYGALFAATEYALLLVFAGK